MNVLPTGKNPTKNVQDIVALINSLGTEFVGILQKIFLDEDASSLERDAFTLLIAQHFTMKPDGLAAEYFDHFLSCSGKPKRFDTEKLLREDSGVRERVISEVARRAMGIKTLREKDEDSRMTLSEEGQRNRKLITVFQKNFSNPDWQLALGTFNFEWEVISQSSNSLKVQLSGKNTYRWHPDSKRISQFVHRAGDRMASAKGAANFDIIAIPTVISVSTANRDIYERFAPLTQSNPNSFKMPVR